MLLRHLPETPAERQQQFAATIGEKAKEPNADKALRQDMEEKAPQKLCGRYGHQLLFAAMRIILPAEGHLSVSKVDQSVVGNSNTVCVASEML